MSENTMNRKQRRQMEKNLGITKQRKKYDRKTYFEILQRNVQEGKKKQEEMKELRRRQEQESNDDVDSKKINQLATEISEKENIPFIDAVEKAKQQLSS